MSTATKGKKVGAWALGGLALTLISAACAQGVSKEAVASKDQEITALNGRVAALQQDATYWKQLTALFPPVELRSMTDHRAYMLPSGVLLALHFDNMNLNEAKNLNWVALGIPGKFCRADQQRIEKEFGSGFTHFHDLKNDTHGGNPGAQGVWFAHIAVRDFSSPMSGGAVKAGVDTSFMPTAAPAC